MPPAPAAPVVIKIGGRSLEAPGAPEELAAEVASLSGEALLVHGGGRDVSDWCKRLGITPQFVDGLRVTDPKTLEVAVAVLGGLANKRLVALLRAAGVDAVGLSAVDGGVVEVEPHPDAATLGAVGQVRAVEPALLETLLLQGRTPVLSSIGALEGRLLNLNADELAASLAGALRAHTLILLSDTPGLRLDGVVVPTLAASELEETLRRRDVSDGMVAKLHAAGKAIAQGVAQVRIAAWSGPGTLKSLIAGTGIGTTLIAADPAQVH
jgi:acetylglutamate kinase